MKFCEKCGSFMKSTGNGLECRKCGNSISIKPEIKKVKQKLSQKEVSVFIIPKEINRKNQVYQECPKCGNKIAYHRVNQVSGEHAGIRQERTIQHFTCTKCGYSWGIEA